MEKSISNKLKAFVLAGVMVISSAVITLPANAASKPATPTNVKGKGAYESVNISWKKAKNAKTYTIRRYTGKAWKYKGTVKKTSTNKKKYTKKNVYKVIASGKNYKVYRYISTYKVMKSGIKKTSVKLSCPAGTQYFSVRSDNGTRHSSYSKNVKVVSFKPSDPVPCVGKVYTGTGTIIRARSFISMKGDTVESGTVLTFRNKGDNPFATYVKELDASNKYKGKDTVADNNEYKYEAKVASVTSLSGDKYKVKFQVTYYPQCTSGEAAECPFYGTAEATVSGKM